MRSFSGSIGQAEDDDWYLPWDTLNLKHVLDMTFPKNDSAYESHNF